MPCSVLLCQGRLYVLTWRRHGLHRGLGGGHRAVLGRHGVRRSAERSVGVPARRRSLTSLAVLDGEAPVGGGAAAGGAGGARAASTAHSSEPAGGRH